jgi:hypothetical protein
MTQQPDQIASSAPPIDYRQAARSLSKITQLLAGNTVSESDLAVFDTMSEEDAKRYIEALSGAANAVAQNGL